MGVKEPHKDNASPNARSSAVNGTGVFLHVPTTCSYVISHSVQSPFSSAANQRHFYAHPKSVFAEQLYLNYGHCQSTVSAISFVMLIAQNIITVGVGMNVIMTTNPLWDAVMLLHLSYNHVGFLRYRKR